MNGKDFIIQICTLLLILVDWALAFSSFIIATQHSDNPLYCFIPAGLVVLATLWTHKFLNNN